MTTPLETSSTPSVGPRRRKRRGRWLWWIHAQPQVLGLAWINGTLHAATYRRQEQTGRWICPHAVTTTEEFETALEAALQALAFTDTEVFLVLEHESFQHQSELAPPFSEAAMRTFLKGRVARLEQERGSMLWVSQRTSSQRSEATVLLHLLSSAVYDQINRAMLARRLDLTRIVPLTVPLQQLIDALPEAREQPVLIAAPAGATTVVLAGRAGQPILFSRQILAPWGQEPARLAIEINRSLLYAKQQFGTTLDCLRLLGPADESLLAEVRSRCSNARQIEAQPSDTFSWLLAVARLPARHPVNLVAGYLSRKHRQRLLRRVLIGACSLAFVLAALDAVVREQRRSQETQRFGELRASEGALREERARLVARNTQAEHHAHVLAQAEEQVVAPVPARLLAALPAILPIEIRLTQLQVRHQEDAAGWYVRLEGSIDTDDETARELLDSVERQLTRSPFRATFPSNGRTLMVSSGASPQPLVRFALEGGLLED